MLLALPALLLGQDSLNVTKVGGYPFWDGPSALDVHGTYAYVAAGLGGLRIVDISDPAHLIEVGHYNTPDHAVDVELSGQYAYVADLDSGLIVIDVSNASAPVLVSSITFGLGNSVAYVEIHGDTAFVSGVGLGVVALDISTPDTPAEIGRLGSHFGTKFTVSGNALYEIYHWEDSDGFPVYNRLYVYDISDFSNVQLLTSHDPSERYVDLEIQDHILFAANSNTGVRIFNITDSDSLELLGVYESPTYAYRCKVAGDLAYVSDFYEGLRIVDVSNPSEPVEVATIDTAHYAQDISFSGELLLTAAENYGLRVFNVANPSFPVDLTSLHTMMPYFQAERIQFYDHYALVAEVIGMGVYDISDPRNVVKVNEPDTMIAWNLAIYRTFAYLLTTHGIRIVDISNPAIPVNAGYYPLPGNASEIEVWNNYLLVDPSSSNPDTSALHILDISNPISPTLAGIIGLWAITDIEIVGDTLFLPTAYDGFYAYDISNPANPVEVEFARGWDPEAIDLEVFGGIGYAATCGYGLKVFDFSGETAPIEIGSFDTDNCTKQLDYWNGYVFLSDTRGGLRVVDVSNPSNPTETGYFQPQIDYSGSHFGTQSVILHDGLIFAAETHDFSIYDISAALSTPEHHTDFPTQFSLHPIYPNPFNNTANITFDLPREVTGRLVVYDVLGRMTSTLYDGKLAAGSHQMQFNGKDLSSGTYFVRLETPTFTATQKAVLLK